MQNNELLLAIANMLQPMEDAIHSLQRELSGVKREMSEVKREIAELKRDVTELKSVEKHEQMKSDIKIMQEVVLDHSKRLQTIPQFA